MLLLKILPIFYFSIAIIYMYNLRMGRVATSEREGSKEEGRRGEGRKGEGRGVEERRGERREEEERRKEGREGERLAGRVGVVVALRIIPRQQPGWAINGCGQLF